MNPILNPWPLRLALPADRWTRKESGYMRSLLEIAIMRYEQKNLSRASVLIDRGLKVEPASPEFLSAKGMLYLTTGDAARALGFFDRSIQSHPEYDLALYGRGLSLETLGDRQAARESYLRLLSTPQGTFDKRDVQARIDRLSR